MCPLALVAGVACTPDIPRDPVPLRVVAQFDPSAELPIVPKPNDLAIDAATGFVNPPDAPDASEADKQFNRYLRTLDGFPTQAVATHDFSGALDPASVTPGALRVLDVTDPNAVAEVPTQGQLLQCRDGCTTAADPDACVLSCYAALTPSIIYDPDRRRVRITAPWQRARLYAVALLGGAQGLRGAGGVEVVGSPAFVLLRAKKPLTTCADLNQTNCRSVTSLIDGGEAAVTLERVRRQLRPGLDYLEKNGVTRESLVAAWTFRTVKMGVATFDPAASVIPFPNDLLLENGRVNIPAEAGDDATAQELKARLNQLDGFSTTASMVTDSSDALGAADTRLDGSTLDASQFRLINLNDPTEQVPFTVQCRGCGTADQAPAGTPDQVALKPTRPLRPNTRYAVLWLSGARTLEGRPVVPGSVFALTRLTTPVFAGDRSTLDSLDDASAALLEPLRERTQEALAAAEALQVPRELVLLAWTFTTQSTAAELLPLAAKPAQWNLPSGVTGGPANLATVDVSLLATLGGLVGQDLSSQIRWVKEGDFTSANAFDPNATEVNHSTGQNVATDGPFTSATLTTPRQESRRFLLAVPTTPKHADGRIPVVIYQHGLGQSRRDAVAIANSIARAGYATLAIDAPFHGLRSYCHTNNACRGGSLCINHRCADALADPNDGYLIRNLGAFLDPLETPAISSNQFNSTTHLFATRDHFRHQVIDIAQLLRVLSDTTSGIGAIDVDDPNTAEVERLEPANPRYIGQSMGAIMGALVTAALPEILAACLNVPGASQTDILLTAEGFRADKDALDAYLTGRNMPPGSAAYERFMDIARWALDPADPQNVGRHLIAEPLTPSHPRKRIFISWIQGDLVVPNPTTEALIRSIDAALAPANFKEKKYTGGNHAFLLDLFSGVTAASLAISAQNEAVQWVDL